MAAAYYSLENEIFLREAQADVQLCSCRYNDHPLPFLVHRKHENLKFLGRIFEVGPTAQSKIVDFQDRGIDIKRLGHWLPLL